MSLLLALLFAAVSPIGADSSSSPTWQADIAHCRAEFTVSHLIVSKVWGHIPIRRLTIANRSGTAIPQSLDAVLDVSHEDTDNHERDADLRSPTYFDTERYPTMTFRSTSIVATGASSFDVTGELSIKNVTKPVTFHANVVGVIPDGGGWRAGYEGQLKIDRRDWGIDDARLSAAGVLLVGYSVDIALTVEATAVESALKATPSPSHAR